MRKTVVVLLTSLLLASLPVQGDHTSNPGAGGSEQVTRVVHDCLDDYTVADGGGNDLSSLWVGEGVRDVDPTDGTDLQKVILVDVVLSGRTAADADGVPARLSIQMEVNNNVFTTVLESPPDDLAMEHDWQSADTILYISGESNLKPLGLDTRSVETTTGSTPEPRGHRVVEVWYRYADVFAPGSEAPPATLTIDGKWDVRTSRDSGDGFEAADVMPGSDASCDGHENEPSNELTPPDPAVTGIEATVPVETEEGIQRGPAEDIDRRPETKVRFHALMDLGGGDPDRAGYTYAWTFENGDDSGPDAITSTEAEPEVSFRFLAPVDATVTVTDDLGLTTETYKFSTENPDQDLVTFENLPPTADFRVTGGKVPVVHEAVSFEDLSFDVEGDDVASWSWDFGDGSAAVTDQNPSHTYAGLGAYDVTLTVTDEHGDADSHVVRLFVCEEAGDTGCKPANTGPQADFEASARQVTQGGTVTFTDASSDRDGTVASWSWDFGDGQTSSDQNPQHRFDQVGTFSVTLTVTDDGGLEGKRAIPIRVVLPEPETDDDGDDDGALLPAPQAAFTIDPEDPVVGREVRFRDDSTSQTEIVSWTWFFGDGTDAVQGNDVRHTYAESGTYKVRLIVTDARSVRDLTEQTIVVGSGETDEGAPGVPVALLLAAVALAAVAARRRD